MTCPVPNGLRSAITGASSHSLQGAPHGRRGNQQVHTRVCPGKASTDRQYLGVSQNEKLVSEKGRAWKTNSWYIIRNSAGLGDSTKSSLGRTQHYTARILPHVTHIPKELPSAQPWHVPDILITSSSMSPGVNIMFACDNGSNEEPIGSVTLGSRRFSMSLETNVAVILMVNGSVSR